MSVDLAILIPTLVRRRDKFARLMRILEPQLNDRVMLIVEPTVQAIEALAANGEEDERTIGTKRNELVNRADNCDARYVVHFDDDDFPSHDYIARIMEAIAQGPDVVSIQGMMTVNGKDYTAKPFYHAMKYPKPTGDPAGFYQPPNHLDPTKIEFALSTPFLHKSFAEDQDYSARVYSKFDPAKEIHIDAFIYNYDFYHKNLRRRIRGV